MSVMSNELEVVHNKKKLLQYDRRERSSKLIYIACYSKDENQVLKKTRKAITSLLRLFHSFTTLLLKEYFAMSSLTLFSVTLMTF